MTASPRHPLIGKFVRYDGGDSTTSKFVADLGSGLMLAQRFSAPLTGRALAQSHVVVLASLAQSEFNEIFDSWEAFTHGNGRFCRARARARAPQGATRPIGVTSLPPSRLST